MVSIYVSNATQIASYPTLLLITTLYRLSLDISATRLILLQADAGEVIRSFACSSSAGTSWWARHLSHHHTGAIHRHHEGRGARGGGVGQVYAGCNAGQADVIDAGHGAPNHRFQRARRRRETLSRESAFYGAMDGAMKFVKATRSPASSSRSSILSADWLSASRCATWS